MSNPRLRQNRYQSQLFTDSELKLRAAAWAKRIEPLYTGWRTGCLKDAEVAGFYLLHAVDVRLPDAWLGGCTDQKFKSPLGPKIRDWFEPGPRLKKWIPNEMTLAEFLPAFHIRGVRQIARDVLVSWMNDEIALRLTDSVPTPEEILSLQVNGSRWVTTVFTEHALSQKVHDGRDALSFLLHDLGHAGQFFRQKDLRLGQIGSYVCWPWHTGITFYLYRSNLIAAGGNTFITFLPI